MPKRIEQILETEEATHLAQFTQEDKDWINGRIHDRADGEAGIECVIRGKKDDGDYFKLTPEEIVRQYYAYKLIKVYGYSKEQIKFELPAVFAGKEIIKDNPAEYLKQPAEEYYEELLLQALVIANLKIELEKKKEYIINLRIYNNILF